MYINSLSEEDFRLICKFTSRVKCPNGVLFTYFLFIGLWLSCLEVRSSHYSADTVHHHIHQADILESDTTITAREREQIQEVKSIAAKKKWTDNLYGVLFSEPALLSGEKTEGSIDKEFKPFDGFVINDIKIIVLEPFETGDPNHPDSSRRAHWLATTANKLHTKTKQYIVRGDLMFKVGDVIDPLVIAESEAFLRNTGYIHDARIQIDSISHTRTADVTVIVRDVFAIGLEIHSLTAKSIDMEIYDKNFLGIGSEFWLRGIHNTNYNRHFGYGLGYSYTNFLKTFINLNGSYLDEMYITTLNLSAERPLQTSLRYYGQLSYYAINQRLSVIPWDSINPPRNESFSITLGRAFDLFKHGSAKRLSLAIRYIDNNPSYQKIAPTTPHPMQYEYVANKSFLTQYSFFRQRYYRQYMIHNFGVTENIAYGYNVSGQLGYNKYVDFFESMYVSLSMAAGNLYKFGNLYGRGAIGSHFKDGNFFQSVLQLNGSYFTPLFNAGKNRLRQFININYAKSINPVGGLVDYVYFSTLSNMHTYYSDLEAKGSERFMVNLETDVFTPLNVIGFRFLVFSFFDGGWLRANGQLFAPSNFYWGLGVGVRIRNDLLVFRTLVLKFGYYPRFNQNIGNMLQFTTSDPLPAPSFIPTYPQEITLN